MSSIMENNINPAKQVNSVKSSIVNGLKNYAYFIVLILTMVLIFKYFSSKPFSVKNFMLFQIMVLLLGIVHCFFYQKFIKWFDGFNINSIITTLLITLLGFSLINFSNVISFLPQLQREYALGLTLFLVPNLFMLAYHYFTSIPSKIYKSWVYPIGKEVPVVEVLNSIKVKFYVSKSVEENHELNEYELNVPTYVKLGDFVHYFIYRYNTDKNPESPILISPKNNGENLYAWNFYTNKNKYFRRYLDPVETVENLNLQNNCEVFLERVIDNENE